MPVQKQTRAGQRTRFKVSQSSYLLGSFCQGFHETLSALHGCTCCHTCELSSGRERKDLLGISDWPPGGQSCLEGATDPVWWVVSDAVAAPSPPPMSVSLQAFVAIGDYNGHVGLGVKCSKEVATAIREAIITSPAGSIVPDAKRLLGEQDRQAPHGFLAR